MGVPRTKSHWFNVKAFHGVLDSRRTTLGIDWKQVAAETGVSASTLTRMSQGRGTDLDGLASLAVWADVDLREFIRVQQGFRS